MERRFDAIVVGSGAAGYQAAIALHRNGCPGRIALVTEHKNAGTSRNTGSDKQTYYKLGLGGDSPDSVRQMAADLFAGGCVDGDNALCEAALSSRCFLKLCELGVPFPHNRYGEYVGYKTDHDPYARATSAGPLTSKFMTEALERELATLPVTVLEHLLAVELLKDDSGIIGMICLDNRTGELIALEAGNVILATGGPAGIYADSVYPESQTGSTGLAIAAGAVLQNMTEWQYGLASCKPRWNVSGTYMQVLPRFVSVDSQGQEREFLADFFDDPYQALSAVFLKGYQWPFDSRKVLTGSSVIDLLVYRECVTRGRRVYLDYTRNPFGLERIEFERLTPEAYSYLHKADACFGTPIARLEKMNAPAIELYCSKGVDIRKQYLEIALCAQHNNGGIAVNLWWQTNIPGLFAAGECAGTHGIARPGGSALNAGQVGALRAAQYISRHPRAVSPERFRQVSRAALEAHGAFCEQLLHGSGNVSEKIQETQQRMSRHGAAIRSERELERTLCSVETALAQFAEEVTISRRELLYRAYQLLDIYRTQAAVLTCLLDYARQVGITRGSALIYDSSGILREGLDEMFRLQVGQQPAAGQIQQVVRQNGKLTVSWRPVRPIPQGDDFFENVWQRYRENQNID